MNLPTFAQSDWQAKLTVWYQRIPITRVNVVLTVMLLLLLAWLAARLTWLFLPAETHQPSVAQVALRSDQQNVPALAPLVQAKLFGQYQAAPAQPQVQQPVITEAPKTSLNLKLTGVVATKNKPEQGTAVIESNGVETVYAVDENIDGTSATLKQVLEDRVLLQVAGRFETLMLDGVEYQQLSQDNAPVQEGLQEIPVAAAPVMDSPVQTDIHAVRDQMLAEPGKFFDYVRVTAKHRNGQIYGYALTPGKDPELFARMGLMPNDVAIEINGVQLNDMQQAMGIIGQLREAKEASIKVERDGEIKDILFSLSQ